MMAALVPPWKMHTTSAQPVLLNASEQMASKLTNLSPITVGGKSSPTPQLFDNILMLHCILEMDGRGRALDNAFSERLWRSVKYEDIYLNQYDTVRQLHAGLTAYFNFYNHQRPRQSLDYRTPAEEHFVLCSEPAAFAQMHLIFPISWSNDWGSPYRRG